ncbi:carboxypeptidase-like regulatory domain-containing protein [Cellulophaga baltica]|uniref:Outer membrane protein n=1 Tax=Cellulophaga baltica 18 TaxID=1348584 RepID=A0AAU8RLN4_9FLAO|nr:carboxypeptidase-like regulatory domain-containing protein [Cellulophaga baltica]AIZ41658.1 outer membrane protein [Cellulophaga baltica 18]MCR1026544.1 carboxypeptidase-like regulatory domain-containing protein [Cellulophaga baltica]
MIRKLKHTLVFICFAASFYGQAQGVFSKDIEGKVSSADGDVAATHVLNVSTKKAAITDIDGFFKISASLKDTLVFSAIQFQRKEIIVTAEILTSKTIYITLDPALNELKEVVVMPYNLTGNLAQDMRSEPVVVAATLGLPNAYVKKKTQGERKLNEATTGGGLIPVNPIINAISGRTKMLKDRVKRDEKYARTERVRAFYADTLYVTELKIPALKIDDFLYFCEVDDSFSSVVDTHDKIRIWEFLKKKSKVYRENNNIDTP